MIPYAWVRARVGEALARLGQEECAFVVEAARGGGEVMTNAALVLGRPGLAAGLADELAGLAEVAVAEASGPGFVNLTMRPEFWAGALAAMLRDGFTGMGAGAVAPTGARLFAVQYAHARCHSVLRHAVEMWPEVVTTDVALARAPLARLTGAAELGLIRLLAVWSRAVESREPARLAGFLDEVAAAFDRWWETDLGETRLRLLDPADRDLSLARLGLVRAVASALAAGLVILGVQPMEEMR